MLFFIWKRRNKSYQIEKSREPNKNFREWKWFRKKSIFSLRSSCLEYFIFCVVKAEFLFQFYSELFQFFFFAYIPILAHSNNLLEIKNPTKLLNIYFHNVQWVFSAVCDHRKPNDTLGTKYKMTFLASIFEFFITLSLCFK